MFEAVSGPKHYRMAGKCRPGSLACLMLSTLLLTLGSSAAQAAPRPSSLNVVPTVQRITVQNGGLVAHGVASAVIKGKTYTSPFTAPLDISLAADQSGAEAAGCPILDLALGPINLDLLGLVVQTSPICLKITAYEGGGLLGDLLCSVAHLLDGGLSLGQILSGEGLVDPLTGVILIPGLTGPQVTALLGGLVDLLNSAVQQLYGAILRGIEHLTARQTCGILHLELGPLDLTLLGLNVHLDDCDNGPVTVDITGRTGRGRLLGNLLCGLLDGDLLNLGSTLEQILQQILNRLTS